MISFVISIYNGSKLLKNSVNNLVKFLNKNLIKNYEIILVNDGSIDNTLDIAKNLINQKIKLIGYNKNKGRGYALKYSSKFIKGEKVIFMDLDLPQQADIKIIKKMIQYLNSYDIVVASRHLKESKIKRKKIRLILSKLYVSLIKVIVPELNISDIDCGFKAFKRGVFNNLNKLIKENRWSWDLEMFILARKQKLKIKELPLVWQEEGESTFGVFIEPLKQLITTLRVSLRY